MGLNWLTTCTAAVTFTELHVTIYVIYLAFFVTKQILGLRRAKKKGKETKQEIGEGSSTSQAGQSRISEANMDQEFDRITEKTDENSLLPSQNLLTEESLNERTLVDGELSDTDLQSFNEGET